MANLRESLQGMDDPESLQAISKHGFSVKPKPSCGVDVVIPKTEAAASSSADS